MPDQIKETPEAKTEISKLNNQSINKLLEFHKRVSSIKKDSVNPFFKSKYFDVNTVIDTIKPILNEVGLVVTQALSVLDGKNILETLVKDGDRIIADSQVILPDITDVQKFGAAITYIRRYALVSLLLLQGEEDDDGNKVATKSTAPLKTQNFASSEEWEGAPKAIRPLTKKQGLFIKQLQEQLGLDVTPDEELRKLTSEEASKLIDKLNDQMS